MEGAHLFLGGFKYVQDEDIDALCRGFGPLDSITVKGTFAFAYFKEYADLCSAAEQLNGIIWKGCKLAARVQGPGTGKTQRSASKNADADDGTTLFLGGLAALAGEASIREVCAAYGEVVSVILKPNGYGFVRFAWPEQAQHAAMKLHKQQVLTNTRLTARVQTDRNRSLSTGVRNVGVGGTMLPKYMPEPPKQVGPRFVMIISGFGDTPVEDINSAVRDLCWNYGEVLTLNVASGAAHVVFVEPGVAERMGIEFASGSDWNGHELSMRVDKSAPAAVQEVPTQPAPAFKVENEQRPSTRQCLEVRGFPMGCNAEEIQQACYEVFGPFLSQGERLRLNPKVGCCVVIFPTEQQAHQASVHYTTGALWGEITLTVATQGGSGSCVGTGRLAKSVTKRDLAVLFGLFGTVTEVTVDGDRHGFVDFLESNASGKAVAMANGHTVDGIKMHVKALDPKKPKPTAANPAPQRFAPY